MPTTPGRPHPTLAEDTDLHTQRLERYLADIEQVLWVLKSDFAAQKSHKEQLVFFSALPFLRIFVLFLLGTLVVEHDSELEALLPIVFVSVLPIFISVLNNWYYTFCSKEAKLRTHLQQQITGVRQAIAANGIKSVQAQRAIFDLYEQISLEAPTKFEQVTAMQSLEQTTDSVSDVPRTHAQLNELQIHSVPVLVYSQSQLEND